MKYFIGDIVEILTSDVQKLSDLPQYVQEEYARAGIPIPRTGQRFRIGEVSENGTLYLYGFDHVTNPLGYRPYSRIDFVMLYKRPLKNWIKYIFYFLK